MDVRSRRHASVKVLVWSSFAACILLLGSVLIATTNTGFARERRQARADLEAVARHNATLEAETLDEVDDILGGLAAHPAIQSLEKATCQSAFVGLESLSAQGSLFLLAPDRSLVCSLDARSKVSHEVPPGAWFEQTQKALGSRYLGVRLDPVSQAPQVMFAAPVQSARGTGALLAVLDATRPYLEVPPDADDDATVRSRLSANGQRYRFPVVGRLVRSEPDDPPGLLVAPQPGAPVIAPTRARVAYGGPFRRYGDVLILDHGSGWTTVLTGLDRLQPAMRRIIVTRGNELTSLGKLLESYSYKGVLERGFALVVDDQGHIVRSKSAVRPGQLLAVEVADGQFGAAVSGAPVQRKKPRPPRDDGGQESLF